MTANELNLAFEELRQEAALLAGGLTDLSQRATVYRHIFLASGRNHAFPLIAAHGALWAKGYFEFGMKLGRLLSAQFFFNAVRRQEKLKLLHAFADAFRDINRTVCIDTYTNYHFTARYGQHPDAAKFVNPSLLAALNRIHEANRQGVELSDDAKREVFLAHFLYEQEHVVGPRLQAACAAFDWKLVKFLALMPRVRFAYFSTGRSLWFSDFSRVDERIANGVRAFDNAAQMGWRHVEATLSHYAILSDRFFTAPIADFIELRHAILSAATLHDA